MQKIPRQVRDDKKDMKNNLKHIAVAVIVVMACLFAYQSWWLVRMYRSEVIESIVRPCGLYHTKAASIKAACIKLRDEYDGELPQDVDKLCEFPGVGRKIANLLLGDVFRIPGVVADTHCIRICGRLGFYPEELKDPVKVERILTDAIPKEYQTDTCHRLVDFGRDICRAQSPRCEVCPEGLKGICGHK